MSVPETMRAWLVHEYGQPVGALRLEEVSVPEPGPGELRVRVQAIPLNLNDMERITGKNMMVRPPLPTIPGMEVMGIVEACGEGAEGREGERVVALPTRAFGGFAEYAACPTESAFEMPAAIPLPDAAALYFPFHLAWLGLTWEQPVWRQSQRLAAYGAALDRLAALGLVYPCFCSRKEIAAEIARSAAAPHGPDGPLYPGLCRRLDAEQRAERVAAGEAHALRLDMARALAQPAGDERSSARS